MRVLALSIESRADFESYASSIVRSLAVGVVRIRWMSALLGYSVFSQEPLRNMR